MMTSVSMLANDRAVSIIAAMRHERRRSPRVQIAGEILGHSTMLGQSVEIRDISAGGFLAITRFPLSIDAIHEFRLSWESQWCDVQGRILRCRVVELEGGVQYAAAVEFVRIDTAPLASLREVIERLGSK